MVFSTLFGKKKDKEQPEQRPAKPASSGAAPAPAQNPPADPNKARSGAGQGATAPLGGSSNPRAAPPGDARELARATAEKIDKIESEMTLDYTPVKAPGAPVKSGAPAAVAPPAPSGATISATGPTTGSGKKGKKRPDGTTTLNSLGQNTDIMLGDSILANAMELTDSASSPAVEEAAILYANGQPMPAVAVLADAIKADSTGLSLQPAWLMLFELYEILGKRTAFDNLAIDYAVRFETSAPAWAPSASATPSAAPKPNAGAARAIVTFGGVLDDNVAPQLDQFKRQAQKHEVVFLDFNKVASTTTAGSDLILRAFAAMRKSNQEIVVEGAAHLAERLLASIEVGRRDESNASWMLLLEMYRILGRQAAFEETSIDYCVTYEVSPPSWEPPSTKFRVGSGAEDLDLTNALELQPLAEEAPSDMVALTGDLLGKAEADMTRLANSASEQKIVAVDCRGLRRVDFTAAGVLLNWAVGLQAAGKSAQFRNVSNLVAALFVVMGLDDVAKIERRRV